MERSVGGGELPARLRGGALALGNFDGFHIGHQAVVGRARDWARAQGRPALVATFDPHPVRLFAPDAPPFALTTIGQRLDLFEAFGMDGAVVIPFTRDLAGLSADAFVETWLAERLGVAHVVTGWDFTFGKGRSGHPEQLAAAGRRLGFSTDTVAPVGGDAPVSSTRIRAALADGQPRIAAALLSRPFTIRGTVEHGAKLGRTLDFPTANLRLGDYLRPAYGVYAVRAVLPGGARVDGVANLGVRPMFEPPVELLEVYLFDWSGDLYGAGIEVELIAYLRPEWRLDGLDALKRQIAADCAAARAALV